MVYERVSCHWGRELWGVGAARGLDLGSWSCPWSLAQARRWSSPLPPENHQKFRGWKKVGWGVWWLIRNVVADTKCSSPLLDWGYGGCGSCRGVQAPSPPASRPSSTRIKRGMSRVSQLRFFALWLTTSWHNVSYPGQLSLRSVFVLSLALALAAALSLLHLLSGHWDWPHYHNHLRELKDHMSTKSRRTGWGPQAQPGAPTAALAGQFEAATPSSEINDLDVGSRSQWLVRQVEILEQSIIWHQFNQQFNMEYVNRKTLREVNWPKK